MKKVFAKFLTLVLTITMLVSVMPSAFAEGETVSLPTGNAAGRLTDGLTVKFGDGTDENMTATTLLTDGFHYSTSERLKLGVLPKDGLGTKMITLDGTNNTIEFSWETAQSVKRLEMWIWRVGAVKNYKIQISDDGAVWNDYTTGSFDQTQELPDDSTTRGGAAIFYLAQFNAVTTKHLRFVVTEFGNGQTSAFVAEAIPRSSDMVNLLGDLTLSTDYAFSKHVHAGENNKEPWRRVNASSYAYGFKASAWKHLFQSTNYSGLPLDGTGDNDGGRGAVWSSFTSGFPTTTLSNADGKTYAYYSTSFMASPQSINLIKVPVYSGQFTEAEVYYSYATSWPGETDSSWIKYTTVKGQWKSGNPAVISMPGAPKAEYWMVKMQGASGTLKIYPIEMYALSDSVSTFGDVTFAEGKDSSLLSDGVYLNKKDVAEASNTDLLGKFSAVDSGIEFSYETEIEARRLEIWVKGKTAVKDYEIQIWKDNQWQTHKEGTLEQTAYSSSENYAFVHIITFDKAKSTKFRFVIKSFADSVSDAYISEAILRNTNNINLVGVKAYPEKMANGSMRHVYSPYAGNIFVSGNTDSNYHARNRDNNGAIWPFNWSNSTFNIIPNGNKAWYTVLTNEVCQEINKVVVNIQSGTATDIDVFCSSATKMSDKLWSANATSTVEPTTVQPDTWTKVQSVTGNYSTGAVEIEIPESKPGVVWAVVVNGCSSNFVMAPMELYVLDYNELTPILGEGSIAIADDTVDAGEEATYSIFACNKNYPDAAVFFALYSGDTLIDAAKADMPISGIDTFEAKYTVPTNAEGELTLKAYLWDGKTLVPILNGPAIK